jgi:hypothetical protein
MIPMIAITVTATAAACYVGGYQNGRQCADVQAGGGGGRM